jgi:hypothetical protein
VKFRLKSTQEEKIASQKNPAIQVSIRFKCIIEFGVSFKDSPTWNRLTFSCKCRHGKRDVMKTYFDLWLSEVKHTRQWNDNDFWLDKVKQIQQRSKIINDSSQMNLSPTDLRLFPSSLDEKFELNKAKILSINFLKVIEGRRFDIHEQFLENMHRLDSGTETWKNYCKTAANLKVNLSVTFSNKTTLTNDEANHERSSSITLFWKLKNPKIEKELIQTDHLTARFIAFHVIFDSKNGSRNSPPYRLGCLRRFGFIDRKYFNLINLKLFAAIVNKFVLMDRVSYKGLVTWLTTSFYMVNSSETFKSFVRSYSRNKTQFNYSVTNLVKLSNFKNKRNKTKSLYKINFNRLFYSTQLNDVAKNLGFGIDLKDNG